MERQNPMTNGRSNTKQIRTPIETHTLTETEREKKELKQLPKQKRAIKPVNKSYTKQKTWEKCNITRKYSKNQKKSNQFI